ncbi:MAG: hypothetical protein COA62_02600 [Rhodobiaceae bacterium]|nr:MAG: hypothetical protein COA62_02600 [Rhodobiaceae bacterium]
MLHPIWKVRHNPSAEPRPGTSLKKTSTKSGNLKQLAIRRLSSRAPSRGMERMGHWIEPNGRNQTIKTELEEKT